MVLLEFEGSAFTSGFRCVTGKVNLWMIASTAPKRDKCPKHAKIYPEKTGTFPGGASDNLSQADGIVAR
jgi:hypothetical protein